MNTFPITITYLVTEKAQIDAIAKGETLTEVQKATGEVDLETALRLGATPNSSGVLETGRLGLQVVTAKAAIGYSRPTDHRYSSEYGSRTRPWLAGRYDSVQSFETILADYFRTCEEREAVAAANRDQIAAEAEAKRQEEIKNKLARVDWLDGRVIELEAALREVYRLNEDAGPGSRRAVRDAVTEVIEIESDDNDDED